ncbi:MoeA N-terminal region-like protein [Coniochaeta ligniaria NRRL 30616]|uniref:molybdopterin adenylyltransferase n=1 Tax=Coniochaeta ligniaria NRRL 30616 TaxID=1408157 RepID=A0A1J7JQL4_9PEZI|nr:MoeA N-terminal region-like protein [Coniochaeta ligniaria NRRL 30616]
MSLSYAAALSILHQAANAQRELRQDATSSLPLEDAVGRVLDRDLVSNESTPPHDTAAMDGYAIHSEATRTASPGAPVRFRIRGRIGAGDDPRMLVLEASMPRSREIDNLQPCIEIMTGAVFPDGFDACVRYEDTVRVAGNDSQSQPEISVTKPISLRADRRLAGSDVKRGDVLLRAGATLQASNVLLLASLGLTTITVAARPRVCVFSTGKELLSTSFGLARDTNGPFITAALKEIGSDVDFGGVLDDDAALLRDRLEGVAGSEAYYDVVITTGAVSKGCFDHIPDVLVGMNADIQFHGVAIRPGHPVLFALLTPRQPAGDDKPGGRKVAFFGLPGNPGAAAACLRFIVVPYLRCLTGQGPEAPIVAGLEEASMPAAAKDALPCQKAGTPTWHSPDIFRHGVLRLTAQGTAVVRLSKEQSPAKLAPFTTANCWVHFRPNGNSDLGSGLVECLPLVAGDLHL